MRLLERLRNWFYVEEDDAIGDGSSPPIRARKSICIEGMAER